MNNHTLAAIVLLASTGLVVGGCGNESGSTGGEEKQPKVEAPTEQETALLQQQVAEAKKITMDFVGSLKGELKKAMQAGGPVNALSVCHTKAIPITNEVASRHGVHLSRVSLKNRNPNNVPNEWQKPVLGEFDARAAKGEDPKTMAFATIVEVDGKKQFRFMKAMPVGKVCLNCHGTELKPEVRAKLDDLYPDDKATGYSLGQVRGAVVIVKDL
jgi:hypothetical protein